MLCVLLGFTFYCVVFENCATLATVCYQELPHPISGILQKHSVLDGVDAVSYTHLDVYKRQCVPW